MCRYVAVGCADGSASVYAIDPLKDDLAATLLGTVFAGKAVELKAGLCTS
jgi:hypothetical protein